MEGQIITVLGPVAPSALGTTDGHNHMWITAQPVPAADAPVLDRPEEILAELHEYRQAGGGSQVDCQPVYAGRDGSRLRWLAEESGVWIVANTGFHLQQYYPGEAPIWSMDVEQACELFLGEIMQGLIETREAGSPVNPGFIKIAVRESLAASPRHLIEAAVQASLESGYLIEMHTERGQDIEAFVDFITGLGLSPDRLVICHIDKRPDLGLHQSLAAEGFLLEYDTFFRPKYKPEEHVWPLVEAMVKAGYERSLVLATDLADGSLWRRIGGGPGIVGFITEIKMRLKAMALEDKNIHLLTGGNIARGLTVQAKEI